MSIIKFLPAGTKLDHKQQALISILETLLDSLNLPAKNFYTSFWQKICSIFAKKSSLTHGLYIYGGVGRGKTMILRAFYENLKLEKKFIHYQDFMQVLHQHLHKLQGKNPSKILSDFVASYTQNLKILCIDEFEVKDIADAMLMKRLFTEFLKRKILVCVTSNTRPDNLYKDGLQRESFLPFIAMINSQFQVVELDNNTDYRLKRQLIQSFAVTSPIFQETQRKILYPLNDANNAKVDQIISHLTGGNLLPRKIEVFGRDISFVKTYGTVLVTDFAELFKQNLSYIDYVNICQNFTVIIVKNIRIISADNNDMIIRFINFVDNAYFYKILLFMTLETEPDKVYLNGKWSAEFERAVSRLYEMNSDLYLGNNNDN